MDQIELYDLSSESFTYYGQTPIRDHHLLRVVRIRAEDPHVCQIRHVRVPREFMEDKQVLEELERFVPSLVLLDRD